MIRIRFAQIQHHFLKAKVIFFKVFKSHFNVDENREDDKAPGQCVGGVAENINEQEDNNLTVNN